MTYRCEKLGLAVMSLVGAGTMRDRLFNAFTFNFLILQSDDFPEEHLKQRFNKIKNDLTCRSAIADEGTAQATISRMSDEEAQEYAFHILNLYDDVCEIDN